MYFVLILRIAYILPYDTLKNLEISNDGNLKGARETQYGHKPKIGIPTLFEPSTGTRRHPAKCFPVPLVNDQCEAHCDGHVVRSGWRVPSYILLT